MYLDIFGIYVIIITDISSNNSVDIYNYIFNASTIFRSLGQTKQIGHTTNKIPSKIKHDFKNLSLA